MVYSLFKNKKYSIRFTVGSLFIIATVFTSFFAIYIQYYFSRQMSEEHILTKLSMASAELSEYVQSIDVNASSSVQILKNVFIATDREFNDLEVRNIFSQVLEDNPLFYSIYFGNEEDDFYQIINLESSTLVREKMNASESDRWAVIKISGDKENRWRETLYYLADFSLTRRNLERSHYFPTQRPWYTSSNRHEVFKTAPYLFQHLKITGQTYAIKAKQLVLGIDIVLSSVNSKITSEALGLDQNNDTQSFIFGRNGEVIASNQEEQMVDALPSSPLFVLSDEQKQIIQSTRPLRVSNQKDWGPFDYTFAGEPKGYVIDQLKLISAMTGLLFEFVNGFSWQQLNQMYQDNQLDVLHSVSRMDLFNSLSSKAIFNQTLGTAVKIGDSVIMEPADLLGKRVAILQGRAHLLQGYETLASLRLVEVDSLAAAKRLLLEGKVDVMVDAYAVLKRLTKQSQVQHLLEVNRLDSAYIPFHLVMKEQDYRVLEIIQLALDNISLEQQQALHHKWLSREALAGKYVPYRELLELSTSTFVNTMVERHIDGQTVFFYVSPLGDHINSKEYLAVVIPESVITAGVYDRVWVSIGITVIVMLILLPISWVFGIPIVKPIIALRQETQKVRARDFEHMQFIDCHIKEIAELSNSMMEMAAEIKQYQESQDEFVEAFIRLIAQAIDDKSPYTAGHCNRVPEIGLLLAKAVEKSDSEKFKHFCFANEAERREFRIAAWLHDCGKITTPEHIVDKGTKLEANYNRIHEIRTRFEVLWRDAEIVYLNHLITQDMTKAEALSEWQTSQQALQCDFAFIARSNVGSEYISEASVERINSIAQQTWMRHFDDRLGLSPFEELAKPQGDACLPIIEFLLNDKPEHIIARVREMTFDEKYGIKVDVPNHLYNLGEIYNLSIAKGTLTEEDRFKINEHMISGIKMLESLPFPPELSRVPRYASTHHETLKGTGYPRRLRGEDLSIPERILVIADIYEALTASDRPYKKAKSVSVAIDIMHKMALDEHLDMDLFLLFLESGVYLEYAKIFLPDAQIDDIDVCQYLKSAEMA